MVLLRSMSKLCYYRRNKSLFVNNFNLNRVFLFLLTFVFLCFFYLQSYTEKASTYTPWSLVKQKQTKSSVPDWLSEQWTMREKGHKHANKAITCSIEMINEWIRSILTYVLLFLFFYFSRTYIFMLNYSHPIILWTE